MEAGEAERAAAEERGVGLGRSVRTHSRFSTSAVSCGAVSSGRTRRTRGRAGNLLLVVLAERAAVSLSDRHALVELGRRGEEVLTLLVTAFIHAEDFLGFERVHGDGADERYVDSETATICTPVSSVN